MLLSPKTEAEPVSETSYFSMDEVRIQEIVIVIHYKLLRERYDI